MKNFMIIFVVALATLQCASALKCYKCGAEEETKCEDEQKSGECIVPETTAEVVAVNCYAVETSKGTFINDVIQIWPKIDPNLTQIWPKIDPKLNFWLFF